MSNPKELDSKHEDHAGESRASRRPRRPLIDEEVATLFRKVRKRRTLDPEALKALDWDKCLDRGPVTAELIRNFCLKELELLGEKAIANLCLPFDIHLNLVHEGIYDIDKLEQALSSGAIKRVKGIGKRSIEKIKRSLAEWRSLPP